MLTATRRLQTQRLLWRSYSTQALEDNHARATIPRVSVAQNSIYVRAWDYPRDPSEAFAILRGVERKYGKLREFKWMRDPEEKGLYQSVLWASFWDNGSLENVPRSGEMFDIPRPKPVKGEGGVGFLELGDLIKSTEREIQPEENTNTNAMEKAVELNKSKDHILTIKVERALTDTIFNPNPSTSPPKSHSKHAVIAHAMLDWGGFAPLPPLYKDGKSPYNLDLEEEGSEGLKDRENLRKVLNKAATLLNRPDPSFAAPPTAAGVEVDGAEGPTPETEDSRPAPIQNRSWSLPTPPPSTPSTTILNTAAAATTKFAHKKRNTNAENAPRNTKQERILAKAKAIPKIQATATPKAPTPAKQKQKQKSVQQAPAGEPQVEADTKPAGPTPTSPSPSASTSTSTAKTGGAEKEKVLKDRFWGVVGKWF